MINVDKGVPIPEAATGRKYPFDQLQVGDSFFAPGKTQSHMNNCAGNYRKSMPHVKFTMRNVKDETGHVIGARVWRVA